MVELVAHKVKEAIRARKLSRDKPEQLVARALELGIINPQEAQLLQAAEKTRDDAIQVDQFTLEEFKSATPIPPSEIESVEL